MFYIFLSICFSVAVSIMLKLAKRYHIDVFQAITWNYSIAILLTWLFLKPQLHHVTSAPFTTYGVLGLLLPSLFVILGLSVKAAGIVRTDVAQRLSLFIPVAAAFLLFGEGSGTIKILGIIVGFAAIICCIPWQKERSVRNRNKRSWLYLIAVFLGFGVIDVLFKQVAAFKSVSYSTSLFIVFIIAFVASLIALFYQVLTKRMKFSWPHILIGWVLGIANFSNILFYIKAHQSFAKNPSIVFSAMNIGVIVLGTLVGLLVFKEKLTTINKIGIALAIVAIIIISHPQSIAHLI